MTAPRGRPRVGLTIAGCDPSGGAGLAADLMVMRDFGLHGTFVVTTVIAQNTRGVSASWPMTARQVVEQLEVLLGDVAVDAVKIGALGSAEVARAVAGPLAAWRRGGGGVVVLDPVYRSGQNTVSIGGEAVAEAIADALLPLCDAVTPNVPEAEHLTGLTIDGPEGLIAAGRALVARGASAALLKVGHLPGAPDDVLVCADGRVTTLPLPRRFAMEVRGTGCHLATALACALLEEPDVPAAARRARAYLDALWADGTASVGGGARVFFHGEGRP